MTEVRREKAKATAAAGVGAAVGGAGAGTVGVLELALRALRPRYRQALSSGLEPSRVR
jgi:hypothetical protein